MSMGENTKEKNSVQQTVSSRQPVYTKTGMIAHFMKGCLSFFVISIVSSFLVTLLEMIIPQIIRQFVDGVLGDGDLSLPSGISERLNALGGAAYLRSNMWIMAAVIGVLAVFASIFRYMTNQFNAIGGEHLQKNMRDQLFSHIQNLPFAWHMKNKTGDIMQRCTSDVERVQLFVTEQLVSIIRIVIMVVLSLYFMFSMNWRLSLISMVAIPIIIAYSWYFHNRMEDRFEKCDANEGILSTIAQENLTGVRVVRAFGREEYERERFEKQNKYYTGLWIDVMRLMSVFWGVSDFISGLLVMVVLVVGVVMVVGGTLTTGEFLAFINYNSMLIWPIRMLGRVISEMSKAGVCIDRIRYIMNAPVEEDKPDAVSTKVTEKAMRGDIVFHDVTFGYEPEIPIVSHINMTIKAGTTFGILGSTGSGKSTLMHLLDRLYELPPENGKITIGGVDIADMKAHDLRKNIGIVLQEPYLFSRTIGENISFANRSLKMDDVRRAARIACIDETISSFTKGYDTVVGERGVTLSGGQKQRTAIARMLTQNAPVMVFDDSLSAVDAETDARIRRQLQENLGTSTVILISHRITTLMQASCIAVLDQGKIVEMGSPEELMKRNGVYRKIYDMQLSLGLEDAAEEVKENV